MVLVAAALCPHPPLLVPAVASGAAPELDGLRSACARAIDTVLGSDIEALLVIGAGPSTRSYPPEAAGTLAGFGVAVSVGSGVPMLPLSLTVGRWLLDQSAASPSPPSAASPSVPRLLHGVADNLSATECADVGWRLTNGPHRYGLLCLGDGSARRAPSAPGGHDSRAEGFDARVVAALAAGEPGGLLALDPVESAELLVAGRPAWQTLAGAAGGGTWAAEVSYDQAPYGVGYFVATWQRHGAGAASCTAN